MRDGALVHCISCFRSGLDAIWASTGHFVGVVVLWKQMVRRTRSTNIGKRVLESAAGKLKPVTLELGGNDSRTVTDADLEKTALFGRILLSPVNWKPGRYGLASTLFEILSFQPGLIRTQVLVCSLSRKASHDFFRLVGNPDLPVIQNAAKRTATPRL